MLESSPILPFDVVVAGAGIRAIEQLTIESCRCIARAHTVFHSGVAPACLPALRAINRAARVVDLSEGEYVPGAYRPDIYERAARTVVDAASRRPGVVLIEPGSPAIADSVTRLVVARGRSAGLRVVVLPGISSVEALVAALGLDPSRGLQVIQAQDLVLHCFTLNPRLASVVLQPGYYDTCWWAGWPRSLPDRFESLRQALVSSYSEDAPAALVRFEPFGTRTETLWFRIHQLSRLRDALSPLHTLFIPAQFAPVADAQFAERIESWDALQRMTLPAAFDGTRSPQLDDDLRRQSEMLAAEWRMSTLTP